jgi:hypothetical protein
MVIGTAVVLGAVMGRGILTVDLGGMMGRITAGIVGRMVGRMGE